MTRFNYLRRSGFRPSFSLPATAAGERTRFAFVVCAFVVALISTVSLVESLRVARAGAEEARARRAATDVSARLTSLRTVTASIVRLERTATIVAATRQRSSARLAVLLEAASRLPRSVWMLSLEERNGELHVHARTRAARDIGETLAAFASAHRLARPVLVGAQSVTAGDAHYLDFEVMLAERTNG